MAIVAFPSAPSVLPAPAPAPAAGGVRRALWRTYLPALKRYAVPEAAILARSLVRESDGWSVTEPDALITAEIVKALFLLEARGLRPPLDPSPLLDRLVEHHAASADFQLTALTLGAAAAGRSRHADALWPLLCQRMGPDVTQSMGVAWALAAVCDYAAMARDEKEVGAFACGLVDRLLANHEEASGLFYSSGRREGWLRRRPQDATLASQVYPIAALAMFASTFSDPEVAAVAARCADRLCALQGPLGQWWWHYNAQRGEVSEPYPVYAVNQDSAVPLALGALQRALGDRRYDLPIARGLAWTSGANELSRSLIDERWSFVGRAIERTGEGLRITTEMFGYQPARFIVATLSDPVWAAEVNA